MDLGTLSFKQWKPNDLQVTLGPGHCPCDSAVAPQFDRQAHTGKVATVSWHSNLVGLASPSVSPPLLFRGHAEFYGHPIACNACPGIGFKLSVRSPCLLCTGSDCQTGCPCPSYSLGSRERLQSGCPVPAVTYARIILVVHARTLGVYRQVKVGTNDWVPMPYLQLKVDDHVGGVQIGVESDDHYQIDTSFTVSPQI